METDAATITRLVRERQGLEAELASSRTLYQHEVEARLAAERAIARCDDHRAAREQVEQENNALRTEITRLSVAEQDWRVAAESQHEDNDGLRREVLRLHQIIGQLYAQSL